MIQTNESIADVERVAKECNPILRVVRLPAGVVLLVEIEHQLVEMTGGGNAASTAPPIIVQLRYTLTGHKGLNDRLMFYQLSYQMRCRT